VVVGLYWAWEALEVASYVELVGQQELEVVRGLNLMRRNSRPVDAVVMAERGFHLNYLMSMVVVVHETELKLMESYLAALAVQ
jgi:hypothetical protein